MMGKKRAKYEGCTSLKDIAKRDFEDLQAPFELWRLMRGRKAEDSDFAIALLGLALFIGACALAA